MATISIAGSMVTPVIAARAPDQRAVVATSVGLVAIGTFALLVAPTFAPLLWALLVGLGQGGCFGLALLFIVLRAADAEAAARLSSMAQAGGYLVGALGPLAMGLLHALSGGWTAPLVFMLSAVAVELAVGLAAARDRLVHYEHHRSLKSIA
jgi:CP family cyanate transporter-like MFS transporter